MAVEGGHTLADARYTGFAPGQIRDVSNLAAPPAGASQDWMSKVLRTTRKDFLIEDEAKWKQNNRTRTGRPRKTITPQGRLEARQRLHGTTLFDFFYRLRIRSNYDDAADFLYGVLTAEEARTYFWNLVILTDAGQLFLENILRKQIGAEHFDAMVAEFLADQNRRRYSMLRSRLRAMQQVNP